MAAAQLLQPRRLVEVTPFGAQNVHVVAVGEDLPIEGRQLVLQRAHLVRHMEQGAAGGTGQRQQGQSRRPDHAPASFAPQAGAAVRTAARRRAERARGLRVTSSAEGLNALRHSRRKDGGRRCNFVAGR